MPESKLKHQSAASVSLEKQRWWQIKHWNKSIEMQRCDLIFDTSCESEFPETKETNVASRMAVFSPTVLSEAARQMAILSS